MSTRVKFLVHKENNELYAFFPDKFYYGKKDKRGIEFRMSYSHIGQHSACCLGYVEESRYATPEEYIELKKELEVLGYDLKVCDGVKTINKIITKVDCTFGAPMGRSSYGTKPKDKKVYDCKVPMSSDGAYDKENVYWGVGKELRVQYTKDLTYVNFYRVS